MEHTTQKFLIKMADLLRRTSSMKRSINKSILELHTVTVITEHVEYRTAFDDFELIEPEFRLRWYKGELMVCKIFKRPESNEKTLRFELNIVTGSVILETVEDQLKNGVSQKQTVFSWPHQKSITY
ncbi:unnamed protein product [Caenorhabditis brenneri]